VLSQLPHSPLSDDLDRRRVRECERLCDVAPDEVGVAISGELEHATAGCQHALVTVPDDEARLRGGVVVLEQREQEAERSAAALNGLHREPVIAVEVEGPLLAVGADEERHRLIVRRGPVARALTAKPDRVQVVCGDLVRTSNQVFDVVVLGVQVSAGEGIGTARCQHSDERRRELGRRPRRIVAE